MPANKTPALFRLLTILTIALTVVGYPATATAETEPEMTDIEKAFDHCDYSFKDLKALNDRFGRQADSSKEASTSFAFEAERLGNVLTAQAETQADKTHAANDSAVIADFMLSYVTSELIRYQTPAERIEMKAVQELWTAYRDKHAQFIAAKYSDDPIASMTKRATQQRTTLTRLAELEGSLRDYREQNSPYYADSDLSLHDDTAKARKVLAALQDELYALLKLEREEVMSKKEAFVEMYDETIKPRLKDVAGNINESAMHWIDINWDGVPELVCWTEGVSMYAWGAHEYLFIISVPKTDNPEILHAKKLDPEPSRGYKSYRHARFTVHPNKDIGTNDALAGLLTYAAFGGSGSTFYTIEIWYNRYRDKIVLSEFTTGFPPMVDIDLKW